jgi:hypothetical protein
VQEAAPARRAALWMIGRTAMASFLLFPLASLVLIPYVRNYRILGDYLCDFVV